ncbi:universal stress protein [Desulforhopalus sp. IMCC35007]|uniref:universal stress protein n=1 Tax=Desulforhopalus sp. IMCC35007 TaxID=2569543 RepID=UPI0010AEC5C8|nr:universal stress protein [Desulforhopalus sp. IMCC35007]TKB11698.1 universal stress protein [Desulforhopalus sp. IMCC35007]
MRKTTIPALTRLLFPVKDFDLFSHSLPLVEFISRTMEKKLERLDLLHVIGGSFLSTHLNNIDFRAGRVLSSELMQRLRTQHYENFVSPLLDKVQNLLFEKEGGLQAKVRVEDGDPVKRIISICEQERYTTLILARRKKKEQDEVAETVLNGVLNHHLDASIYIVGEDGFPPEKHPASRIMIGIDGSEAALAAVEEAAIFLNRSGSDVEEILLVNVRDPSCFLGENEISCKQASDKGYHHLQEAEEILVGQGVDTSKIVTMLLFGRPGATLASHAREFGATMLFIGRRNRMKIAEVLLGSVSGDVIHRCRKTTVVLVS